VSAAHCHLTATIDDEGPLLGVQDLAKGRLTELAVGAWIVESARHRQAELYWDLVTRRGRVERMCRAP
jgi:hypothetical protein